MAVERKQNEEKDKRRLLLLVLIIILLILSVILSGLLIYSIAQDRSVTAAVSEELHDVSDGQVRIRVNSYINVNGSTMENIEFCNINEDRLMKCKIRLADGSEYLYKSKMLEPGSVIKSDRINANKLKAGNNKCIAEIYTYSIDTKKEIGQVNVELIVHK